MDGIWAAADGLDPHRVATLIAQRIADECVVATWQRICLPLLAGLRGESGGNSTVSRCTPSWPGYANVASTGCCSVPRGLTTSSSVTGAPKIT
ncbi:hypothetical protein ACFHW1_16190 [Micromonospora sp. LOL_014]|uniref:hypothetical protein n=1 Tax=Micromonospora sp. LOL_014 TaxID=3345415 RepID=UPI003A89F404